VTKNIKVGRIMANLFCTIFLGKVVLKYNKINDENSAEECVSAIQLNSNFRVSV
jgi:hypothetical protein